VKIRAAVVTLVNWPDDDDVVQEKKLIFKKDKKNWKDVTKGQQSFARQSINCLYTTKRIVVSNFTNTSSCHCIYKTLYIQIKKKCPQISLLMT